MSNVPFIIVRGASGAGKSTFANNIRGGYNAFIFETDKFFLDMVNQHDYHFDKDLLGIAHSWNQGEVVRACRDCPEVPVIVANTFCGNWELKPYLKIAKMFDRPVYVFSLKTQHDNVHGVPDEIVQRHRLGLQDVDLEKLNADGFNVIYHKVITTDLEADRFAELMKEKLINARLESQKNH